MLITYFPVIVSLFTIAFVFFLISKINKSPVAGDKAIAITAAVQEGAMSYLKRQYKTVAVVAVVLFVALLIFMQWKIAVGFLIGAVSCRRG
jgi:K(+)-stimulated pyrophosphate-energized sodium pump